MSKFHICTLAIAFSSVVAIHADSSVENEIENITEYGNCKVYDELDAFTDKRITNLHCETDDAVMSLAIPPHGKTQVSFSISEKIVAGFSNTIQIDYRFGEHTARTRLFDVAFKMGDESSRVHGYEQYVEEYLEELEDSDRIIFKFDGDSAKIKLTESSAMIKDVKRRINANKKMQEAESN